MKFTLEGTDSEIMEFLGRALGPVSEKTVSTPYSDKTYKQLVKKLDNKEPEQESDSVQVPETRKRFWWDRKEEPTSAIIKDDNEHSKNDSVPDPARASIKVPDRRKIRMNPDEICIPKFEWDPKSEKHHGKVTIAELPDGRVMLSYCSGRFYTTKENILNLPFPIPSGYFVLGANSNNVTAIRRYREYLFSMSRKGSVRAAGQPAERDPGIIQKVDSVSKAPEIPGGQEDRKEENDQDWKYKPLLKGVISTRPSEVDGGKIEGTLEAS